MSRRDLLPRVQDQPWFIEYIGHDGVVGLSGRGTRMLYRIINAEALAKLRVGDKIKIDSGGGVRLLKGAR